MVQAFRRDLADETPQSFQLHHLDPSALYTLTDLDTNASSIILGKELMNEGLVIQITKKPGASVIVYARTR